MTEPEHAISRSTAGSAPGVRSTGTPAEAAVALARRNGIAVDEPRILKDGSNVIVHLVPAPVIVRVATFTARIRGDPRPWLEREVALVTALAASGAPVMTPSPLVPPGPHEIDGWAMTAWSYEDHVPGAVPDAATSFAALDDLHEHMARLTNPPQLPVLVPATVDLDLALTFAVRTGAMSGRRATDLRRERDGRLAELLDMAEDRGLLHGDAFPRNSLVAPRGAVWIDLEDCCSGPRVWDDATLLRRTGDPEVERILVARHGRATLDAAQALRGIQEEVWTILHDARRDGRLPAP